MSSEQNAEFHRQLEALASGGPDLRNLSRSAELEKAEQQLLADKHTWFRGSVSGLALRRDHPGVVNFTDGPTPDRVRAANEAVGGVTAEELVRAMRCFDAGKDRETSRLVDRAAKRIASDVSESDKRAIGTVMQIAEHHARDMVLELAKIFEMRLAEVVYERATGQPYQGPRAGRLKSEQEFKNEYMCEFVESHKRPDNKVFVDEVRGINVPDALRAPDEVTFGGMLTPTEFFHPKKLSEAQLREQLGIKEAEKGEPRPARPTDAAYWSKFMSQWPPERLEKAMKTLPYSPSIAPEAFTIPGGRIPEKMIVGGIDMDPGESITIKWSCPPFFRSDKTSDRLLQLGHHGERENILSVFPETVRPSMEMLLKTLNYLLCSDGKLSREFCEKGLQPQARPHYVTGMQPGKSTDPLHGARLVNRIPPILSYEKELQGFVEQIKAGDAAFWRQTREELPEQTREAWDKVEIAFSKLPK